MDDPDSNAGLLLRTDVPSRDKAPIFTPVSTGREKARNW